MNVTKFIKRRFQETLDKEFTKNKLIIQESEFKQKGLEKIDYK